MLTQAKIAESIARRAHEGQVDKRGESYILHVERVAAAVEGDIPKAIAWLHDVLEDTSETPESLAAAGIGLRVIAGVQQLTNTSLMTYAQYIEVLALSRDPAAIYVKLADLRDNLYRPGAENFPSLRERYLKAVERLSRA